MHSENIEIKIGGAKSSPGVWLPCEYRMLRGRPQILSLGDVERTELPDEGGGTLLMKTGRLKEVARDFFDRISPERKIVILIPTNGKEIDAWPCRQVLKADLLRQSSN